MSYPSWMGNVKALRTGVWLLVIAVLTGACGGSESDEDVNRPATFTQSCEIGDEICADPFVCLENPERMGTMCTLSCSKDDECPTWQATGHCAGHAQSRCSSAVCQYACK
jgi:hypothetical protein